MELTSNPSYRFNLWVLYNITAERCGRLWGTWASAKKKKSKGVPVPRTGWLQWTNPRLKLLLKHFVKIGKVSYSGSVERLNREELIKFLPEWNDSYNESMVRIATAKIANESRGNDDDSEDGDELIDDVADSNDHGEDDNMGMVAEELDDATEVIDIMAPQTARLSKKRRRRDAAVSIVRNKSTANQKKQRTQKETKQTEDEHLLENETPEDNPEEYVGMTVRKLFADNKEYRGRVIASDVDDVHGLPLFIVRYDDGDEEGLFWSELKPVLDCDGERTSENSGSEDDDVPIATLLTGLA